MTRRSALLTSSSLALAPLAKRLASRSRRTPQTIRRPLVLRQDPHGRPCRQAAELGLSGIDLVEEKDWPTWKKYGLVPAIVTGAGNDSGGLESQGESREAREGHARQHRQGGRRQSCPTSSPSPAIAAGCPMTKAATTASLGLKRVAKKSPKTRASPSAWNCSTARWTTRTTSATTPLGAWRW